MNQPIVTEELAIPLESALHDEIVAFVVSQSSAHFRQLPEWIGIQHRDRPRLFVSRSPSRQILASSVLLERRGRLPGFVTGVIARGPVASGMDALKAHVADVSDIVAQNYSSLLVNPYFLDADAATAAAALTAAGLVPTRSGPHYSHTVWVEIASDERKQWRSLRRSLRTAINKSRRAGMTVRREDSAAAYREFALRFTDFSKRHGIHGMDTRTAESLRAAFSNGDSCRAHLLTAAVDDEILGQAVLLRIRDTMIYEWGWTSSRKAALRLPVTHRLMWEAIGIGRASGCRALDLGGYWGSRPSSDPKNQFKLGFSKNVVPVCGTYERVFSPLRRWMQKLAAGRL